MQKIDFKQNFMLPMDIESCLSDESTLSTQDVRNNSIDFESTKDEHDPVNSRDNIEYSIYFGF